MDPDPSRQSDDADRRLHSVLDDHIDPDGGSAFWIERARALGIRSAGDVDGIASLDRLGDMTDADLRERPLFDFVPRRYHGQADRLVIGQTGGTTGPGTWTAYLDDEFHEAFVAPFAAAACHAGFPTGAVWLYVGPGGPHIIGQAARAVARSMCSAEPFSVDFDPRWFRKLPAGSTGAHRYLAHVLDQAMAVVASQAVSVLFATPPVLVELAELMTPDQRRRVLGVHYGGLAVGPETLAQLQIDAFPNAVHLAGYGNTLFGCCVELDTAAGRDLDYYPYGHRLILEVVDEHGRAAATGRVRVTRLDHAMLIVRLRERDVAERLGAPADAPPGFVGSGIRNPRVRVPAAAASVPTLY